MAVMSIYGRIFTPVTYCTICRTPLDSFGCKKAGTAHGKVDIHQIDGHR